MLLLEVSTTTIRMEPPSLALHPIMVQGRDKIGGNDLWNYVHGENDSREI